LLFDSIIYSRNNLIFFMIMCGIFLMGFTFGGHLMFGSQTYLYSSVGRSAITLYRFLFGEFFYDEISAANPLLANYFFFLYIIGGFLIM
jgi:hypothetical protein